MTDANTAPSIGETGSSPKLKYYAFISYSHADKRWADWLHKALETYRVPKRLAKQISPGGNKFSNRLFPIFRDREELPVSADLGGNIREALRLSRHLIVICSPRAATSLWVNEEIRQFKALGRADRVQCLIVDGEPNAAEKSGCVPEAECFPPAVRFRVAANGELTNERTEPIAADARPGMDGKSNAKLKLLAGLLGVNFDELKQRERVRRRKRVGAVVFLIALLAAAAAGLWQFQTRQGTRRVEEQRRRHGAAQGEERARQELLQGSADVAAADLEVSLREVPHQPAAELMLGVARRLCAGLAGVLEDKEAKPFKMIMSPSGDHLLVTGDGEGGPALWDLRTRRLLRKLDPSGRAAPQFSRSGAKLLLKHNDKWAVADVATGREALIPAMAADEACFMADGKRIFSCKNFWGDAGKNQPPRFAVYDVENGHELRHFDFGPGAAGGIQVSLDGRTALCGWFAPAPQSAGDRSGLGQARLKWVELDSGTILADFPRDANARFEFSPGGERMLYLRDDGALEVRDKAGAIWATPKLGGVGPQAGWSGGGRYVIVGSHGTTMVLDATNGQLVWKDVLSTGVTDLEDSLIAYADLDGRVRVRELPTGKPLARFADRIGWPEANAFQDRIVEFSRDGRQLLLAGSGHKVKIWDWKRTADDCTFLGDPAAKALGVNAKFNSDGTLLAVLNKDGSALLWDVKSGKERLRIDRRGTTEIDFMAAAISPDGTRLLTADGPATATIRDTATGHTAAQVNDGDAKPYTRVAWGADRFITANFMSGLGALWDGKTHRQVASFALGPKTMELLADSLDGPRRLGVSADGMRFIVAGFDETARVYSSRDGKPVASLRHPFPKLASVELNADGTRALSGDWEGHVVSWDVDGSRKLAAPDPAPGKINEAHLSASGRYIAAASSDQCVRLWDGATGELRSTLREQAPPSDGTPTLGAPFLLQGERKGFLSVQFDPGERWVAGINDNGRICLWELPSGRQLLRWKVEKQSREAHLAVSADGHGLAVVGLDGAVRLFNLTPTHP